MAYNSMQLVALCCQIAKAPGYTSFAGQLLNTVLEELWQVNDFAFSRKKIDIDLTQQQPTDPVDGQPLGYVLPTDHERSLNTFYIVNGAPRTLTQLPIEQYDELFQGVTGSSYPEFICVDVAQSPRRAKFYPLPPLAVGVTMRYLPQQPVIVTPETSGATPWFPNQLYLITRISAELMMITDDTRRDSFLTKAEALLSKFLTMGDEDRENYVRTVKLDPRIFAGGGSQRPTKSMPL